LRGLWEASVRTRRLLRSLARPSPPADRSTAPPLFFHHIAKTGGTSFVRTMRTMVPRALQASENGDLSAPFVQRLAAKGLRSGQFIYGHPGTSAALPLRGRTCMTIMLREPREQAISNYLWLLQDWRLPDHALAASGDFRDFLRARPYFAIFQTASLHVGVEQRPLERTEDLIDRLPDLVDYLHEFELVGITEAEEALFRKACQVLQIADPPKLPHHRKSRLPPSRREQMREQYEELEHDPKLGPLIRAERALYLEARFLNGASTTTAEPMAREPGFGVHLE
jgi:hypothetical protein